LNERTPSQATACKIEFFQVNLQAGAPEVEGLPGIKEMEVKAVSVGKHHDMCCPPYMGHQAIIVFHVSFSFQ
jgi:hypothetical protein